MHTLAVIQAPGTKAQLKARTESTTSGIGGGRWCERVEDKDQDALIRLLKIESGGGLNKIVSDSQGFKIRQPKGEKLSRTLSLYKHHDLLDAYGIHCEEKT